MGLFSKKRVPDPVLELSGLRIWYSVQEQTWTVFFQDVDFVFIGSTFNCPSESQLGAILEEIDTLKPEMLQRLADGWKDWEGVRMNDGEMFDVHLTNYPTDGSYDVCWSGGTTWGDFIVSFTVKAGTITNETWDD